MQPTPALLISVIIPTYNFGHLISYTLDSLLSQTFTNWECIVVDDGSKDNTEAVMAQYMAKDKRISYHKQPNSGPAMARNTGINLAKGKYLQFLDADDLLQPKKIEYQINVAQLNPLADVIYGPTLKFTSSKANPAYLGPLKADNVARPQISGKGKEVVAVFLTTTFFPSCGIIKRSMVNQLNGLDKRLIQSEDWDLYLRAAEVGGEFIYLADTPTDAKALIRSHEDNNTKNFFRLQYYVVKMRQQFTTRCTDAKLLQLNQYWMLKNLEDLIFEIQQDLDNGHRKLAIKRSFKTFMLNPSVRYFIYALASIVATGSMYRKITLFSFSSFFKA